MQSRLYAISPIFKGSVNIPAEAQNNSLCAFDFTQRVVLNVVKTSNLLNVFSTKGCFFCQFWLPLNNLPLLCWPQLPRWPICFFVFMMSSIFVQQYFRQPSGIYSFRMFAAFCKFLEGNVSTVLVVVWIKRHLRWLQNGADFWCNEVKANWIRNCCCSFPFFNVTINNINTTNEWIALKLEWKITSCPCNCFCKIEFAIVACSFP